MSKKFWIIGVSTVLILAVLMFGGLFVVKRMPFWANMSTTVESAGRDYSAKFHIPPVHSIHDGNHDGVDDQTNLLRSAKVYLSSRPKYASKYYATGYPDDGYGVCTDVIAQAFVGAGYDFRELVDTDIHAHPHDYAIEVPDKNIDFRRVPNLLVYFQHTASALTTDPHDYAQWQPGDIVIFNNHIGMVSDRRDAYGIPYVLHHNNASQKSFEEDILLSRHDIVGHFRVK
ncbi:DUF1287 domain-containing protein [Alloscardovia venturai]|uniref:DUF1287 domain-containing protein n=1 Tax=Alloscardovia venturai TaxID=1769421 RepID=A0ABW2Y9Q0_9BIFI